jgi:tetratricopeptide (TPR) repeat protein
VPQGQALGILGQLTEAHLLTERASGRFGFHDLLRVYSCERGRCEDSDQERSGAVGRALDHYLYTGYRAAKALRPGLEAIGLDQPQPGVIPEPIADYDQALAWFDAEHQVLTAVENLALSGGFDTHGWQLGLCLMDYLNRRGFCRSSQAIARAALAAAERTCDRRAEAMTRCMSSRAAIVAGSYAEAEHHLERMLALAEQLGDGFVYAHGHLGLGGLRERQGRHGEALSSYRKALTAYASAGSQTWQALTLNNIGWSEVSLGNYQRALASCEQAMDLLRELDDKHSEALCWDSIGYAHYHLARQSEAIASYRHALALVRRLGDRFLEAEILQHLGDAYDADSQPGLAADAWRQSLAILDDLGHPRADQLRPKLQAAVP